MDVASFVVKMGALNKYGRGWIGGWKSRWFVLNNYGELSYYENEMAFLSNPVNEKKHNKNPRKMCVFVHKKGLFFVGIESTQYHTPEFD